MSINLLIEGPSHIPLLGGVPEGRGGLRKSGGAATIIAAQGFNPGFRIQFLVQKGGALARACKGGLPEASEYLAGPPDLGTWVRPIPRPVGLG